MEAKRTWSEAQRMTQQMRKDRGFGKGSGGVKCFNCGGSHFARDCPDKRHPSFPGKGKGKQHYVMDTMDGMFQAKGKGKSKHGKGKSKSATWVDEADAMWSLKGKGKSKVSFSERPSVNVYNMDYDLGGMEMEATALSEAPDGHEGFPVTTSSASASEGKGMLDCGATASAAPTWPYRTWSRPSCLTMPEHRSTWNTCGRISGLGTASGVKLCIALPSPDLFLANSARLLSTLFQTLRTCPSRTWYQFLWAWITWVMVVVRCWWISAVDWH